MGQSVLNLVPAKYQPVAHACLLNIDPSLIKLITDVDHIQSLSDDIAYVDPNTLSNYEANHIPS